ncbi:hypothetical protein NM208_g5025 [Fusarium decemcellulare]|uniref:Uncharacterized protein n=1 Tax=Fusarium decemcellulare TaxID=57161 RepID=A0ACC1SIR5_9HYPO|nr:hypothetical protein NM208_g5025 [Fusarium decemcellulare]
MIYFKPFLWTILALRSPFALGYPSEPPNIVEDLGSVLSEGASVTTNISSAPRWSDYHVPRPGYIVQVAEEEDVAKTVEYCNKHEIKFLAQSGAHGWARTFDIGDNDVVIDLTGLNSITFNEARDLVTIGGGTLNGDWVDAAYANGVQVLNGGCNCVGVLGATLGGGVSRWMNRYGMPVDNVVSANLVTSDGELIKVSKDTNSDLFWAILGAGPNFGIVTSVVMNAYPLIDEGRVWTGELIFSGDKLEAYIAAVNGLNLTEDTTLHWGFSHRPNPVITAQVFFMRGDAEAGREAFRSLYNLEPDDDTTQIMTYPHINDDTDALCVKGGRKPGWFTGLETFDYPTFQAVWDEYIDFVATTNLTNTTILIECYSNYVLRDIGSEGASYAHRAINYYAWTLSGHVDSSSDAAVEAYSSRVRELWRSTSGFEPQRTYINFAYGDESLEEIYGESLPRLRQLKKHWDPKGRFDQWFAIS